MKFRDKTKVGILVGTLKSKFKVPYVNYIINCRNKIKNLGQDKSTNITNKNATEPSVTGLNHNF